MRHSNRNKKFGREMGQRVSFLKGLAINLFEKGKIETTLSRAKAMRPLVERLITLGKLDNVARRRIVSSRLLNNESLTKKIFTEISPKYKNVEGGYTRVLRLGQRLGDGAEMAIIELI